MSRPATYQTCPEFAALLLSLGMHPAAPITPFTGHGDDRTAMRDAMSLLPATSPAFAILAARLDAKAAPDAR